MPNYNKTLKQIEELLSPRKMAHYKNKYSERWFEAYKSELQQAKEVFIYLHFLEIFLRNKISFEFRIEFGDWLLNTRSSLKLNFKEQEKVSKTIFELARSGKEVSADHVISNLNFGFWTNLFHKSYNYPVWQKNKMIERIFPYLKDYERNLKKIQKELEKIRKFRNRIFHFENLQSWNFDEMKGLIEKFIYGISGVKISEILSDF